MRRFQDITRKHVNFGLRRIHLYQGRFIDTLLPILIFLVVGMILSGGQFYTLLVENIETRRFLVWVYKNDLMLERGWSAYAQFSDRRPLQYADKCETEIDGSMELARVHTWNTLRVNDPQLILTAFEEAHCQYGEIFSVHFLHLLEANGRLLFEQAQYVEAVERMRIAQASLWSIRREHRFLLPPYCIEAFQSGRFVEAELLCQINDEAGQGVTSAVMLGRVFLAQERLEEASSNFLNAIERDLTRYEGYFWLGQVEWALGDYDQAVSLFEQSLALEPNNGDAWLMLIKVNLERNNIEAAHIVLQEARRFLNTADMERAIELFE